MTNRDRLIELLKMIEYQYTEMHSIMTQNVADFLLQRGVIVPPCKVGDVVWLIGNMKIYTKEEICSRKVTSVQMLRTGELIMHFKDGCFSTEAGSNDFACGWVIGVDNMEGVIDRQPTADVVEVKHGKWLLKHIGVGHYWECSECEFKNAVMPRTNYCPNCGAKMDSERNDEDGNR